MARERAQADTYVNNLHRETIWDQRLDKADIISDNVLAYIAMEAHNEDPVRRMGSTVVS